MSQVFELTLDPRLYAMVRTMSGPIEGTVEIITNVDDAYNKGVINGTFEEDDTRIYNISVNYSSPQTIVVTDNAIGMSNQELFDKMSNVGAFTSEQNIRGFFSRGIKDLIGIGNVTILSVKDGLVNELTLTMDSKVIVSRTNDVVTQEERDQLGIPVNGTCVSLVLHEHIVIPAFERMGKIRSHYNLRDIFTNQNNNIVIKVLNGETVLYNNRLVYFPPEVHETPILDSTFHIEGWPEEAIAHFKVERIINPTGTSSDPQQYRQHGILVCTDNAIHDNTGFYSEIENNPFFTNIRGRLTCPYLDTLMYQLEESDVDPKNMFPVIFPDRSGLDKRHPFVKELYRIAYYALRHIFAEESKKYLNSDDAIIVDITSILEDVDLSTNSTTFAEDLSRVSSFYFDPTIGEEQTNNFLKKTANSIIDENKDADYNLADIEIKAEKKDGHIEQVSTTLQLIIVSDHAFNSSVRAFHSGSKIIVELNAEDEHMKQCTELIEDSLNLYEITDMDVFRIISTRLTSEALTSILHEFKIGKFTDSEIRNLTFQDHRNMQSELNFLILPKIHILLSENSVLQQLVSNDAVSE